MASLPILFRYGAAPDETRSNFQFTAYHFDQTTTPLVSLDTGVVSIPTVLVSPLPPADLITSSTPPGTGSTSDYVGSIDFADGALDGWAGVFVRWNRPGGIWLWNFTCPEVQTVRWFVNSGVDTLTVTGQLYDHYLNAVVDDHLPYTVEIRLDATGYIVSSAKEIVVTSATVRPPGTASSSFAFSASVPFNRNILRAGGDSVSIRVRDHKGIASQWRTVTVRKPMRALWLIDGPGKTAILADLATTRALYFVDHDLSINQIRTYPDTTRAVIPAYFRQTGDEEPGATGALYAATQRVATGEVELLRGTEWRTGAPVWSSMAFMWTDSISFHFLILKSGAATIAVRFVSGAFGLWFRRSSNLRTFDTPILIAPVAATDGEFELRARWGALEVWNQTGAVYRSLDGGKTWDAA